MNIEKLTKEQMEKLRNCKNQEEAMAVIESEGIELDADDLEKIAGGGFFDTLIRIATGIWNSIT